MILDFPSHNLIVWWNAVLRPCVLQFGNLSTGIPWSVLWLLRTKIREPFGLSQIFCLLICSRNHFFLKFIISFSIFNRIIMDSWILGLLISNFHNLFWYNKIWEIRNLTTLCLLPLVYNGFSLSITCNHESLEATNR